MRIRWAWTDVPVAILLVAILIPLLVELAQSVAAIAAGAASR